MPDRAKCFAVISFINTRLDCSMSDASQQNVVGYLALRGRARVGGRTASAFPAAWGTTEISFAGIWEQVDRSSAGLRKAGLEPGDRAILMIPMSIDLYVALLAVLKIGAIGVFVDPWVGRRQIATFAAFASPTAWIGVGRSHLLRMGAAALRRIRLTVTTGRRWFGLAARHTLRALADAPGNGHIMAVAADRPALITFTSGSSGLPKGTNRTHGFLTAQHAVLSREFPAFDADVDMPMFPVFALHNLAAGIPSVVPRMDFRRPDRVDGRLVVGQMRRQGVTTCTGSPSFIDRIVGHLEGQPQDRPPLRRILTGGAPVTDRQLEHWRRVLPDMEITVVYGSTEAEPVAHLTADERLATKSDVRPRTPGYCVGRPSPQVEVRIVRIHRGPIELASNRLGGRGWDDWRRRPRPDRRAWSFAASMLPGITIAIRPPWRKTRFATWTARFGTAWAIRAIQTAKGGCGWRAARISTIFRDGVPLHPQLIEQAAAGDDPHIRRVAAVGLPTRPSGSGW